MHQLLRRLFVVSFLLIPAEVGFLGYVLVGFHSNLGGSAFNRSENGVWLEHRWVEDPLPQEDWQALGEHLTAMGMKHVYVHTGPFEEDGAVSPSRYPQADKFLAYMNENFPNLTWYAWLGQLRSKIDLDDAEIRGRMVATAESLIDEVGFEGIHYDIEPIHAGDTGFLDLLGETRSVIGSAPLSIAADEWQPEWLSNWVAGLFDVEIVSYWSTAWLKEVLPYVDQVALMGYDTSISSPEWYRWFLEQQVIYVSKIATKNDTDLLIGLPAYDEREGHEGFHAAAENIENGLLGVLQGLNNTRTRRETVVGVAVYAYWEMDENEWGTYEELWVQP